MAGQYDRGLKLFPLATNCVDAGLDYYKRKSLLEQYTLLSWKNMVTAALSDDIQLFVCSAFRDYHYQAKLIMNKLAKGYNIKEALTVLAPPGFSEHHTGCAIDIISLEISELSEAFEKTMAFAWLEKYAGDYGFFMSYPRNNIYRIIYEPWHWCYKAKIDD